MNVNIQTKGVVTETLFKAIPQIKEEALAEFKIILQREERVQRLISSWEDIDLTISYTGDSENRTDMEYLLFFDVDVENAMSNNHYIYDIAVTLPYSEYCKVLTQNVEKIDIKQCIDNVLKIKEIKREIDDLEYQISEKKEEIRRMEREI